MNARMGQWEKKATDTHASIEKARAHRLKPLGSKGEGPNTFVFYFNPTSTFKSPFIFQSLFLALISLDSHSNYVK